MAGPFYYLTLRNILTIYHIAGLARNPKGAGNALRGLFWGFAPIPVAPYYMS
jgi:hypothetical protein